MPRIGFIALLALAGCGNEALWGFANPLRLFAGSGLDSAGEDDEEADGPSLHITQGSVSAIARLIDQQGERRMWRTRGGVVIATDGVRVVATAGLAMQLAATRFDGPDPLGEPAALLTRSADSRRMVDLMENQRTPEGMRFGVALNCRLVAGATEDDLVAITETCRSEQVGTIQNRFWMERDSTTISASEQWIGPGIAHIQIEHATQATPAEPPP